MGRWRPILATIMCLFFGFVTQMASQLQTLSTPMPSQLLLVLPYIATIIAVAGLVGRVRPPAADGVPYEKLSCCSPCDPPSSSLARTPAAELGASQAPASSLGRPDGAHGSRHTLEDEK